MSESGNQAGGDSADGATDRFAGLHAEIQELAEFVREIRERAERHYKEWRLEPLDTRFKEMGGDTWFEEYERRREEYERRMKEHDARWEDMQRDIERRLDALERRSREEGGREPQTGAPEGC